jgi:hypothetical protein
MIPIRFKYAKRGVGFDPRTWRMILATAWNDVGEFWHEHILPKHFTTRGAAEYGYQPRSKRWMIRKAKKYGHQNPLVWTGELKRQALRMRDVRASSSGARVVIHGPRYLYQYRKNANDPRKAQELAMISIGDAEALAAVMDKAVMDLAEPVAGFYDVRSGQVTAA